MAREVRLWEFMRDGLKGTHGLHMRRVENLVSSGDPDVDGCCEGDYFEVELKGCNRPVHPGTELDMEIRPSQVLWHRKRWRCGGNVWLYVRVGYGRDVARYLVPGCHTSAVAAGITEQKLADLAVLPSNHTASQLLTQIRQRCAR